MSSKLVVPADIFNLFEIEKLSKIQSETQDSSSSKNRVKAVERRRKRKRIVQGQIKINENLIKYSRSFPNILKKHANSKSINEKLEKSDNLDKMASGDMNCSNRDNNVNHEDESLVNGEPPRTVNVFSSMTENVEISPGQTVEREGSAQLELIDNYIKNKNSVLLIKSSNGKSIPLVIKNSVLIKSDEEIDKKVFAIKSPSTEISTSNLKQSPNNKTSEVIKNKSLSTEKLEISTEKSTKISTEISTKISTEKISSKKSTPQNKNSEKSTEAIKPQIQKNKLVIHRKLVTIPTTLQVKPKIVLTKKSDSSPKISTALSPKPGVVSTSSAKELVIKTASGKQIIIPNKKPLKVEILEKNQPNTSNTKNILINNQLVPISSKTKFTEKINTVDKPKSKCKLKKNKNIPKISTEEKVYQLQVPDDKEIGPNLHLPIKTVAVKDEVDILNGCVQMPMYVENWTQTDVKQQDSACQTDVYVSPTPIVEPIEEDCLNIPELIQFILGSEKYNTGMDETTKTDILNNSQKFKPPEPAPIIQTTKPPLTLKEQLFHDLRDCIGFDFLGNMPIHNAVIEENLKDLKRQVFALRLRRFTVDVENNLNYSALQLAVIHNRNLDIIGTLLINGANVCVKDSIGNSLLHLAVLNTNQHVLDLILGYLSKDSNVLDAKNDEGLTALMVASIECKPESVAVLLKHGANPNLRDDKSGRTALFHAVELNNIPAINLLLQNKADPKIRNYFGLTALDAVKEQNTSVVNLIEKQVTRTNAQIAGSTGEMAATSSTATPSTATRGRPNNKRRTPEQPYVKMTVVSKKLKVETGIKTCSPARKKTKQ